MKYNKGFAPLILVAIIVGALVIGGGVYYLGKSKGEDKKVGENLNVENKEIIDNPNIDNKIQKPEALAPNALLYKGDGFTVNSPYSLSYVTVSKEEHFSSAVNFNNGDCVTSECVTAVKMYIKDGLANKKAFDSFIEEFLNNFSSRSIIFPSRDKITATNVTVDNESAVQYTFKSFAGGYDGIVYYTVFFHNGKGYIVSQKDTTISKFLSSFKFIDSEESSITKNDVTNQPAYLKSVYVKDGKNYIDVDYVQWIVCSANIGESGCENGYKIVNDNPLIRTFLVSDNVVIKMQTFSHKTSGVDKGNYNWNEVVSLEKFKGIINGTILPPDYNGSLPYKSWFKDLPYSVTVKNGVITEITERYIP